MLSLVMPRDGWHPPVIRTVATENRGIDNLTATIAKFAPISNPAVNAPKTHRTLAQPLAELLEACLVERVLNAAGGEAASINLPPM
jgi:putative protein kinase ArgK-like GTPase of G3E family